MVWLAWYGPVHYGIVCCTFYGIVWSMLRRTKFDHAVLHLKISSTNSLEKPDSWFHSCTLRGPQEPFGWPDWANDTSSKQTCNHSKRLRYWSSSQFIKGNLEVYTSTREYNTISPHHHNTTSPNPPESRHRHITTSPHSPHSPQHHIITPPSPEPQPQNHRTTKPQNRRTTEPHHHITVELLC